MANANITSISGSELLNEVDELLAGNKAEDEAKRAAKAAESAKAERLKMEADEKLRAEIIAKRRAEEKAAEMEATNEAAKAVEIAAEAARIVAEAKPVINPVVQPIARVELTKAKPNDDFDITEVSEENDEDDEEMLADDNEENDEENDEENVTMTTTSAVYPSGTPSFIIDLLNEDKSTASKISLAVKEAKKNDEIKHWAALVGSRGMPKKELREYAEVKKGVREAFGITNAQVIRPITTTLASTKSAVKKAVTIVKEEGSILEALTPKKTPIKKFVNQRTEQVYLLWTDLVISTCKDYELRLRKFTVGENSKPTDAVPNVYLMKGDQVLLTLNMNEYIVMINMIKQLQDEKKMEEIFQAVLELRQ